MKISTKGRYALRMMLDIAENQGESYISLNEVAARQNLSKKYLEQIVPAMNRDGMLKRSRGYQGGYKLAKDASEYTVGDILRAVEGSLAPVPCLEDSPQGCEMRKDCLTLPIWQGLEKVIDEYLDGITLQDVLNKNKKKNRDNYVLL